MLPVLGGSAFVWSTCALFFQAVLLLGYLYAHGLAGHVPPSWQRVIHGTVLAAAAWLLAHQPPIGEPGSSDERVWLIAALTRTVGFPFFALSATAPLLQQWFASTRGAKATQTYRLFAASNAGSLAGLLGYLLVEPAVTLSSQLRVWAYAFAGGASLIVACLIVTKPARVQRTEPAPPPEPTPTLSDQMMWVLLAAVPSVLVLGVTQHLATDVVSTPFLWVIPLAVYLATFVAAFARVDAGTASFWGAMAAVPLLVVIGLFLAEVRDPIPVVALAHLVLFAILTMMCHRRLAERRPATSATTRYLLCVATGGLLGSVFVVLIAPSIFSAILEYPMGIAAAMLLRPQNGFTPRARASALQRWMQPGGAALVCGLVLWGVSRLDPVTDEAQLLMRVGVVGVLALLLLWQRTRLLFTVVGVGVLLGSSVLRTGGDLLHRERTFFGVHRVTSIQGGAWHELTHGTTLHGVQATGGKARLLPTAYYHPSGPIGDVVFALSSDKRLRNIAVIGLGAGALAGYVGNGMRMVFYELDEAVIRIAEDPAYFTYLSDARARGGATVSTVARDGRVGLQRGADGRFDLVVIDAFSSDAIPVHLLTAEAIDVYASRLEIGGALAFHVSNRFFHLAPVLADVAAARGLVCYVREDQDLPRAQIEEAKRPSVWVVMARSERDIGALAQSSRWQRLHGRPSEAWTDDYANVLGALQPLANDGRR